MTSILVVADEPWVFDQVRSALGDSAYSVSETTDPRSVAADALETTPDALVVDMQIGSMGGMAVTRAVRDAFNTRNASSPPVVLLLDRDADAFLAGRSGATAWVRKPFGADDLRTAIAEALS